jgi:signal transduction histidine kinase
MKNFYIFLLVILVWPVGVANAQLAEADSLIAVLKNAKEDTAKINLTIDISKAFASKNPEKALRYAKKAYSLSVAHQNGAKEVRSLRLIGKLFENAHAYDSATFYYSKQLVASRKWSNKVSESDALDALAQMSYHKGDHEQALTLSQQALVLAEEANDSIRIGFVYNSLSIVYGGLGNQQQALAAGLKSFSIFKKIDNKEGQVSAANNIGYVYDDMGSYAKALEYYLIALQIAEKEGDKYTQTALMNNIGLIYEAQKDTCKALDFYYQAHRLATELNNQRDLAFLNHNIGIIQLSKGNMDEAYKYISQSLATRQKLGFTCDMSMDYASLSTYHLKSEKYDSAFFYNAKALSIAEGCQDKRNLSSCYNQLGLLYQKSGKAARAVENYKKALALAKSAGLMDVQKEVAGNLYKVMKDQKRFDEALAYFELSSALKDSLFNEENTRQMATLEAEYNFEKVRERLAFDAEKDNLKYTIDLARKDTERKAAYIGLGLLTLLLIALGLLFANKRGAHKALQAKNIEIQNQNEEILSQWELLEHHKAELENKVLELDHLNKEKIKLISMVSHDLRSPLNQIKGLSHLIKMDKQALTPEQDKYLDLILSCTERLTEMICRILDINAVESNSINLMLEVGDVGEVLSYVETNYQLAASKKGITLHSDVETGRYFAEIDKNYLIQVLENLVTNALKFSQPGSSVFLRVFEEGKKVKAIVTDNGPGISEEDQQKLFGEYQKLTARPTGGEASSGLGLAIVKRYLLAMHADIEVLSELGKGASFIISFDRAEVPQAEFVI